MASVSWTAEPTAERHNKRQHTVREHHATGNRATKTASGGAQTAAVDDQDRLTSYGGATYQYTAHGDLRRKIVGTDTTEYTYDALGNLTRVELPNGTVIGYLLDAMNRRIGKTVNDTLVRAWLYQGQLTPVAELDGAGTVVSRFVYATGTIAQRVIYDEFGIETENTNPGWQPFGYAGGLTFSQTELVRFGARDYAPVAGRWTAKDPIEFAGGATSLYENSSSDPVNRTDPSGRRPVRFGNSIVEVNDTLLEALGLLLNSTLSRPSPFSRGEAWTDIAVVAQQALVDIGSCEVLLLGKLRNRNAPMGPQIPGSLEPEFPSELEQMTFEELLKQMKQAKGAEKVALNRAKKKLQQAERLLDKLKG